MTNRAEVWEEWAIDGMPKDKQRLADAVWQAATKHQDALIAAAYLDAIDCCEKRLVICDKNKKEHGDDVDDLMIAYQTIAKDVDKRTPSDAKAALRELCLRVANESIEKYRVEDFAWDETAEIEAIVDGVLGK